MSDSVSSLTPEKDVCLLQQYEERLTDMKWELPAMRHERLSADSGEIDASLDAMEQDIFECSLKVRKLLRSRSTSTASPAPDVKSIKLPRLDVPKFDGSILNWMTFWEQFSVSIHARHDLTDAEKLAYLRSALKNGRLRTSSRV